MTEPTKQKPKKPPMEVSKKIEKALIEITALKTRVRQLKKLEKAQTAKEKSRQEKILTLQLHDSLLRDDHAAVERILKEIKKSAATKV